MTNSDRIIADYQRGNAVTRAHLWMRYSELRQTFDRLEPPARRAPRRLRSFSTITKARRWVKTVSRRLHGV